MYEPKSSRMLYNITGFLAFASLFFGAVFIAFGLVSGDPMGAIGGAYLFAAGLSLMIVTHMGKGIAFIAETNSAILEKLDQGK